MLDQLSPLTMIQVDLILTNDYPPDSCAVSPTAFLLTLLGNVKTDPGQVCHPCHDFLQDSLIRITQTENVTGCYCNLHTTARMNIQLELSNSLERS